MGKTSIPWCDESWPIVNGCARCSPGCEHCYAERLTATRLSKTPKYQGLAVYGEYGPRWTRQHRLWLPHLDMPIKLKAPRRIFVADMGDLFFEPVWNEEIAAVFGVMAACPQHTFQVLTKRPARMLEWFAWVARQAEGPGGLSAFGVIRPAAHRLMPLESRPALDRAAWLTTPGAWPLSNVWLGVSVESQRYADERIPLLLQAPAGSVRFLSVEPQLEQVVLPEAFLALGNRGWCIQGGESGPGARPFDVGWARAMRDQCGPAGIPYFLKQVGAKPYIMRMNLNAPAFDDEKVSISLKDRKGEDWDEWSEDLRRREFPSVEER